MEKANVKIIISYFTNNNKAVGIVYDHQFHQDGTEVVTSEIISRSEHSFETANTIYTII